MDRAISDLVSDSGGLVSIHGRAEGVGYRTLAFVFEHGILRFECQVDSDEVAVSVDPTSTELPKVDDGALASLHAKVIELAWTMTNNRGFSDGFQLRCIDLHTRAEATVQLEAAAGVLTVARVSSLRGH